MRDWISGIFCLKGVTVVVKGALDRTHVDDPQGLIMEGLSRAVFVLFVQYLYLSTVTKQMRIQK